MLFLAEDATHSRPTRSHELQAVILAGFGNRLGALTEEENLPKALLPVANRPMIAHVMLWIQRCGIHDITIVTPSAAAPKISHAIRAVTEDSTMVAFVTSDDCQGSADALRLVRDRIKYDVFVVGCDFITDMDPHRFLDMYRLSKDTAVTAIFYESSDIKDEDTAQFVGVTPDQQLVAILEASQRELPIRASLLWKFPRVRLRGNLLDAHAYIFSRWVLDYLADRPRFISISEDLLPALVKMQWKRQRVEREGIADYIASTTRHHDVIDEQIALSLSTTQLPVDTTRPIVRCRAYIVSGNHVVIGRANTIPAYCELNRHLTKATNTSVVRVHASAEIDSKTQIGPDSMIGESTRMEERCSVKRSIIGAHCQIGKQVKIVNSIIMDGVSIGDNVKLDGCVVCQQAKILERSNLKDTVIGAQVIVPAETTARNEQFRRDMTE